jgi:hypothetical protein
LFQLCLSFQSFQLFQLCLLFLLFLSFQLCLLFLRFLSFQLFSLFQLLQWLCSLDRLLRLMDLQDFPSRWQPLWRLDHPSLGHLSLDHPLYPLYRLLHNLYKPLRMDLLDLLSREFL